LLTRNIAKKGLSSMRSSSLASSAMYFDSDVLRNPFLAILPSVSHNLPRPCRVIRNMHKMIDEKMEYKLPQNLNVLFGEELKDYFVFYCFKRQDEICLLIYDKTMKLIEEIDMPERNYFSSNFHYSIKNELIFSVTISATTFDNRLPETKDYYQFYETKWYKVSIKKKATISVIEEWKKSEIKDIKSIVQKDKVVWVSNVQNVSIVNNRYKKRWALQFAITSSKFELPKFRQIESSYSGIKDIDALLFDEKLYIGAVCQVSWDKAVLLSYDFKTELVKSKIFDFPLKKLHNYDTVKLQINNNDIICFFNSISQEYSKKYEFKIYRAKTGLDLLQETESDCLNEYDFVRGVKWMNFKGKLLTSYAYKKDDATGFISEVNYNEKVLMNIADEYPILITSDNKLLSSFKRKEPYENTYFRLQELKTMANTQYT